MSVFVVVFALEPQEFVVEATLRAGVIPGFIVARIATSVSSSVLNKACLSRGEAVGFVDGPVPVVVVVWHSFAGGTAVLELIPNVKVCERNVE